MRVLLLLLPHPLLMVFSVLLLAPHHLVLKFVRHLLTAPFLLLEAHQIKDALEMYETRLKAVSFLRYKETGYIQAPYEPISKETYEELISNVNPIHRFDSESGGSGTKFCDGESCTI